MDVEIKTDMLEGVRTKQGWWYCCMLIAGRVKGIL